MTKEETDGEKRWTRSRPTRRGLDGGETGGAYVDGQEKKKEGTVRICGGSVFMFEMWN